MTDSSAANNVLGKIDDATGAYMHVPEHGFSLFLANRTKTIHFVRHAEGRHNQANRAAGSDLPVIFSTPGSWEYQDAQLTETGIQQCLDTLPQLANLNPELILVSPFTRALQTAHILFGGKGIPFMVHDLCRERSGLFTCDKRRSKTQIWNDIQPLYEYTNDRIDHERFGYPTEEDEYWTETREPSESVTARAIQFMQFLATRPEQEIAVVTHSSWLKHLFRAFGEQVVDKDMEKLHRIAGNAEVRSICLAMHKGFYPAGVWENDSFVPHDHSFRRGRWAPSHQRIASMHGQIITGRDRPELAEQASMPHLK